MLNDNDLCFFFNSLQTVERGGSGSCLRYLGSQTGHNKRVMPLKSIRTESEPKLLYKIYILIFTLNPI